ncbi:MAG: cytochrome C [Bacteroidales bacterium]|nr:cytochrome C [Bacteroidales bacterium]
MTKLLKICMLIIWIDGTVLNLTAQISPGKLTAAHEHLEGLANCTECHVLGDKNTTQKCLECHIEIKDLIEKNRGYHASSEVREKECHTCHGEHFGRDFKIVRLDKDEFNHDLTGYMLEGRHKELKCEECHNSQLVRNNVSQKKGNTYLGLMTGCTSCHEDYHQNTLNGNCISCHSQESFSPAPGFDHDKTEFPLIGMHQTADCTGCHAIVNRNGRKFQLFSGIPFSGCVNCHDDVHMNKFGNDCRECHNEFSFQNVNNNFDHNLTNFPLNGMHRSVDCKQCHTKSFTEPLVHDRCTNCHKDYHEKQFQRNGNSPDCIECHDVNGFSPSLFGIDKHTLTAFPLEGAHMATPCFSCHKENNKWKFINLQSECSGCHENVHENYLDNKFVSDGGCKICHNVSVWSDINFDHNTTNFELKGRHAELNCRECHFKQENNYLKEQQFKWEQQNCTNCHTDIHYAQFDKNGKNDCERCHTYNNWIPEKFSHDESRFKLDGQHKNLACSECHKLNYYFERPYVVFKFDDISCESCH